VINGAPKSSESTKEVEKKKKKLNFRNSSLKELIDETNGFNRCSRLKKVVLGKYKGDQRKINFEIQQFENKK